MKNFDNYECDGQINLWDYLKSQRPKIEPNDSVCEGCKWRNHKSRYLEVDDHGKTWVYCCPGTACANWRHGTPLNLDFRESNEKRIYCYNRDFLPELKDIAIICEDKHRRNFKECEFDGRPTFIDTYKKAKISLYEDRFTIGECERFISVDLNTTTEGFGVPCQTLDQVLYWLDKAYKRADKISERRINGTHN